MVLSQDASDEKLNIAYIILWLNLKIQKINEYVSLQEKKQKTNFTPAYCELNFKKFIGPKGNTGWKKVQPENKKGE